MSRALVSIIDDDDSVRKSLASLVRSLGIDARTFASGALFLSSDCVHLTQCMICDVAMPHMDGIELYGLIRQIGYAPPIIFMTAFWSDSLKNKALANGAVMCLEKPVHPQVIENALKELLNLP
ncbi:response regulator transcription factor [Paraburkholderia caribensis]|nr:response regulator [Paraburkholderia caribensis]